MLPRSTPVAWLAIGLTLASPGSIVAAIAATSPGALTADAAWQIVRGCVAHAKAKGQSEAIAVYDDGGHPIAVFRMDGNAPGITEFAMQKAEAVAYWHFSSAQMLDATHDTPGFANAPHVVTVAGGIPAFTSQGRFVGAVGVSGEAPSDDAACAEAGIKAAGFSPTRRK
jgi:uncharacterized protein GlcG (DUF336 family)